MKKAALLFLAVPVGSSGPAASETALRPALDELGGQPEGAPTLLVHYHKTGHHVCNQLAAAFAAVPLPTNITRVDEAKRTCTSHDFRFSPRQVQAAPSLFCEHSSTSLEGEANVVHMTREPVDMAISAYLYHRQQPPPERWLTEGVSCERDEHNLRQMAASAAVPWEQVAAVGRECDRLLALSGAANHYDALHALSQEDGLRLEAARSLVSRDTKAGADILRMAANARWLDVHVRLPALAVLEPTWYDVRATNASIAEITRRVLPAGTPQQQLDAKAEAVGILFRRSQLVATTPESQHATVGHVADEERRAMAQLLEEDVSLGPVLLAVRRVVVDDPW